MRSLAFTKLTFQGEGGIKKHKYQYYFRYKYNEENKVEQ